MSLAVDHFGSHVLNGTTEWKRFLLVKYRLLAEPKVGEFYVTVGVQKYAAVTLKQMDTYLIKKSKFRIWRT